MKRSEFLHEIPFISDSLYQMVHNVKNGLKQAVISLSSIIKADEAMVFIPVNAGKLSFRKDLHQEVLDFIRDNAELLVNESHCLMVQSVGTGHRIFVAQMIRKGSNDELYHMNRIAKLRGAAGIYDYQGKKVIVSKVQKQ